MTQLSQPDQQSLKVRIWRGAGDEGRYETFDVPVLESHPVPRGRLKPRIIPKNARAKTRRVPAQISDARYKRARGRVFDVQ